MQPEYVELRRKLSAAYSEREAAALAMIVLEDAFRVRRTDIYAGTARRFTPEERRLLDEMAARLAGGEPLQYVLGYTYFAGRRFRVSPAVLIPRPETEELAAWACREEAGGPRRLLDAGTGSGCIAVTLAAQLPEADVEGWDLSEAALDVARENARENGCRVRFERRDLLAPPPEGERFDAVVSNPPYVRLGERAEMEARVADHEPAEALFVPDDDPLLFYRALCRLGRALLPPGGRLYVEINRAFGREAVQLMEREGYGAVELRQDACGNDRMARGVRRG